MESVNKGNWYLIIGSLTISVILQTLESQSKTISFILVPVKSEFTANQELDKVSIFSTLKNIPESLTAFF